MKTESIHYTCDLTAKACEPMSETERCASISVTARNWTARTGNFISAPRQPRKCGGCSSAITHSCVSKESSSTPRTMSLHEELLKIVTKLPTDFEPYGERDRDTAEPSANCSCGCRHFLLLAGELGNDSGICANPVSPRRGLLTFEHMGCPEFKSEKDEIEAMEQPSEPTEAAAARSAAPLQKLNIEWWELELALESQLYGEMSHYLDRQTGKVLTISSDCSEDDEQREAIESETGERYLHLEPLESHESFRIMEHFASSLPESPARARLFDALSRKKPFRHFKDAVHPDVALRDQWFLFQNAAREQYVRDWLQAHGIEAEFVRPRLTKHA